ncbi:EF-hand domain-containing protein [Luteolibacter sp. LG18]|uniref:EF-hand domain-containing protein n=1 Tax=Luteolibacter sp. LG18 TaxID=2819286 RepID=UPI002B321721|nr:hypothetical protein llg_11220 [Luteolibacter sp. LG18]
MELSYWDGTGINPNAGPLEFLFCALDSSRDDRLTQAEWQGIYAKIPKKEAIFPVLDTDRDSFLSFVEFKAGTTNRTASKMLSGPIERTQAFLNVDTSLDNVVSRTEIALMWKPGTTASTIDSFWSRAQGGAGMDFWDWLWAKSLPSFSTFDQARTLRAQRMAVAAQLDANQDSTVSRTEFARLYPASTKASTIDTAWASATATPRGATPPVTMTITQFVEAARLPKLVVY